MAVVCLFVILHLEEIASNDEYVSKIYFSETYDLNVELNYFLNPSSPHEIFMTCAENDDADYTYDHMDEKHYRKQTSKKNQITKDCCKKGNFKCKLYPPKDEVVCTGVGTSGDKTNYDAAHGVLEKCCRAGGVQGVDIDNADPEHVLTDCK